MRRCESTSTSLGAAGSGAVEGAASQPSLVSGIRKKAPMRSAHASAAAASGGAHAPKWLTDDPSTGPSTIPRPMPAPRRPMPAARRSPVVTSAMAAWQAERLPAVAPARMRETKSSQSSEVWLARAKSTIAAALPASDSRITGRRPKRSERRPRKGVAMNWVSEKDARMNPTVSAEPPMERT